jgi:hypothetical protein
MKRVKNIILVAVLLAVVVLVVIVVQRFQNPSERETMQLEPKPMGSVGISSYSNSWINIAYTLPQPGWSQPGIEMKRAAADGIDGDGKRVELWSYALSVSGYADGEIGVTLAFGPAFSSDIAMCDLLVEADGPMRTIGGREFFTWYQTETTEGYLQLVDGYIVTLETKFSATSRPSLEEFIDSIRAVS